jgi:NADH:ubiquinone oxidoreductase subunit 5 (subunit L)/multisubunit Na+/H+ antiporter MnhA subunit
MKAVLINRVGDFCLIYCVSYFSYKLGTGNIYDLGVIILTNDFDSVNIK